MPRLALALLALSLPACGETKKDPPEGGFREPRDKEAKGGAPEAPKTDQPEAERKIIYTGALDLQVEDYAASMEKLSALLKEAKGYVASSEESGSPGAPRRAVWTVKVPASAADGFRREAAKLGEVLRNTLASEDVTERDHDTAAQQKHQPTREEAL
ncbi:MAG: DUF4349 domain-containing protein, partial [Gemmataceae bacterium]|nr:DUF4349 domain-containing protein [Gemmataceae bacterium]